MSDTEMADGTTTTTTSQPQRYFPIARSRRGSGLLWQGAGAPSTRSMSGSIPLISRSNSGGSTSSTSISGTGPGAAAPLSKPKSSSVKSKSSAKPRSSGGGKGKQAVYAASSLPPTASASSVSTETTVKQSPPNSSTSRRSSLANLVHNLDMSDTEEVQQLAVLPGPPSNGVRVGFLHNAVVREDDDDDDDDDEDDEDEDEDEDGEQEGGGGDAGELEYIDADGGGDSGEAVVEVGEADDDEEDSSEDDESSDESEDEDDPNAVHSTESKPNSTVIPHHQPSQPLPINTNGVSPPSTNGQVPTAIPAAVAQASISVSTPSTPKPLGGPGGNGIPPPPSTGGSSALTSPPTSTPGPGYIQNALAQAIQAATASQSQSLPPPTTHTLPNASTTPVAESTTTPIEAGADPSSTATVKGPSKQPKGKGSKPKKHRTPSPSPPPPAPPPPITTIRLELKLGGPSNYEVDIARKAKETGQRAWSPEPPVVPVPEVVVDRPDDGDGAGEGVGEGSGETEGGGDEKGKKKRKKKSIAQEYYDTSDPFIDDSELAVDQRTYFAQTKQQGFYVSSGEVALLKDTSVKSPKKPKSKKNPLGGGSLSVATGMLGKGKAGGGAGGGGVGVNGDGTKDSPIALVDDDDAAGHHGDSSSNTLYGVISKGIRGVGLVTSAGMIGHGAGAMKVDVGGGAGAFGGGGMSVMNSNATGGATGGGGGMSVSAPPGGSGRVEVKMEMDDEGDERVGMKRKRYITVVDGGKKRKIVNINSFHPDLQAAIENLKQSIAKENWENKGKFPPNLKPQLAQLALLAIRLDEYDDHFFNLMPVLFPYNKFTMTKLIKRTVYPDHIALLQARQDELLKQLEDLAKAGFTRAEEEYQKSLQQWSARQERERLKLEAGGGAAAGLSAEASADGSAAPSRHPTEERDKDAMDVEGGPLQPPLSQAPGHDAQKDGGGGQQKKADHPPTRRYRLTEQMRGIIWDLVLLSNEACRLENEKNTFEGSMTQVSEQGGRKVLYQKIVSAFPEGWMSSGQISRDVSAMKKRFEKEAMEEG